MKRKINRTEKLQRIENEYFKMFSQLRFLRDVGYGEAKINFLLAIFVRILLKCVAQHSHHSDKLIGNIIVSDYTEYKLIYRYNYRGQYFAVFKILTRVVNGEMYTE